MAITALIVSTPPDCAINQGGSQLYIDKLERVIAYLNDVRFPTPGFVASFNDDLSEAQDILIEAQEQLGNGCTCDESGNWSHGELRYFNTSGNYKGEPIEDIRRYTISDYERMEAYNDGQFCFIGIDAIARVQLSKHGVIQTLRSGGLWGIESDSDSSHIKETETEQLNELRDILKQAGFTQKAIDAAFSSVEQVAA